MGLDTSAHPVDVALYRDRLVPFVKDGKPIDDLIARAARAACLAARASAWRFAALRFSMDLRKAQEEVVPKVTERYSVPSRNATFFERLLGRKPPEQVKEFQRPEFVPGLAGYDSDLAAWGRPYFMPFGDTARVVSLYERYVAAEDETAIDAIARSMIGELSANGLNFPEGTRPAVIQATKALMPFEKHIRPVPGEGDDPPLSLAQQQRRLKRETELWRFIFQNRNSDKPLPSEFADERDVDPEAPSSAFLVNLPLQMAGFAAELMPGWMSRGYGFASSLFDKIGVKAHRVFETPATLFQDLIKAAPAVEEMLHATITENFCLGGYVPPQKMKAFVDMLTKHRREMVLAFHQGPPPGAATLAAMEADYLKVLEPATFALKHGYGYLEAAEIYSAPLGMAN
jgi:hypothetical protein